MSRSFSPYISLAYDGQGPPSEHEHGQMGYSPDAVALTQHSVREDSEDLRVGIHVEAPDLKSFFSNIEDLDLIFRYRNESALTKRKEIWEEGKEVDEYSIPPAYSFDVVEARLDPDEEWMDWLDTVHKPLSEYSIDRIKLDTPQGFYRDAKNSRENLLDTPEGFYSNPEVLEENLQGARLTFIPETESIEEVSFGWQAGVAEIKLENTRKPASSSSRAEEDTGTEPVRGTKTDLEQVSDLKREIEDSTDIGDVKVLR